MDQFILTDIGYVRVTKQNEFRASIACDCPTKWFIAIDCGTYLQDTCYLDRSKSQMGKDVTQLWRQQFANS